MARIIAVCLLSRQPLPNAATVVDLDLGICRALTMLGERMSKAGSTEQMEFLQSELTRIRRYQEFWLDFCARRVAG